MKNKPIKLWLSILSKKNILNPKENITAPIIENTENKNTEIAVLLIESILNNKIKFRIDKKIKKTLNKFKEYTSFKINVNIL